MRVISVIVLLFFITSCGIKTVEKKDCINSFVLESTKSVNFFIIDVIEGKEVYSSLEINENESFLCISDPRTPNACIDEYPPIKKKSVKLPIGSKVFFTGNIKKTVPFGFSTAFNSEIIYLEGMVNSRKVWLATHNLISIKSYTEESSINKESLKTIGLDSLSFSIKCK